MSAAPRGRQMSKSGPARAERVGQREQRPASSERRGREQSNPTEQPNTRHPASADEASRRGRHARRMFRRHPVLALVTIAYLGVVAWVTLGPQPLSTASRGLLRRILAALGNHELTDWITYDRVEFVANVLMFVPIGLLFVLLFGRRQWWLAVLIGIAITLMIELAQSSIIDRVSDPRDVLANTAGAFLGVLVALAITGPAARRGKRMSQRPQRAG